jgi:hypothetical protein
MKDNILDGKSPFFLRDYHRKYHPVIVGDIKVGFCFGKDETPPAGGESTRTTLQPLQMTPPTEKTPQ